MLRRLVPSRGVLALALATLSLGGAGVARAQSPAAGWTIQPGPNPAGAPLSSLLSVSCSDDGTCMAVGQYSPPGGGIAPLAEYFDGSDSTEGVGSWPVIPRWRCGLLPELKYAKCLSST